MYLELLGLPDRIFCVGWSVSCTLSLTISPFMLLHLLFPFMTVDSHKSVVKLDVPSDGQFSLIASTGVFRPGECVVVRKTLSSSLALSASRTESIKGPVDYITSMFETTL